MSNISSQIDDFMYNSKHLTKEEDLLKQLQELQQEVYTQIADEVNGKLIKELQKNANLLVHTEQPQFLSITPALDQQFMHSHIAYTAKISENNPIDKQNYQQYNHKQIVDFPIYEQNYLDVNANSKFYRPEQPKRGLQDIPQQQIDQTNVQKQLITQTSFYDFDQPEQKLIFPRKMIDNLQVCYPLPEKILKQEKEFKFNQLINKMGGFQNTIQPMMESINPNEKRYFSNTPDNPFLKLAQQEKSMPPPPAYVPDPLPPVPDPFNRNPQYRLFGQNQKQINVDPSYLPVKQEQQESQIIYENHQKKEVPKPQPKLNVLSQAKAQREMIAKKLV